MYHSILYKMKCASKHILKTKLFLIYNFCIDLTLKYIYLLIKINFFQKYFYNFKKLKSINFFKTKAIEI